MSSPAPTPYEGDPGPQPPASQPPQPVVQQQPPGPFPPPYGPPAYPYGPPYPYARRTNTMAILALVFSLLFAPVGIVLGHLARKQIRETGEDGDGLALAGMIIGYIFTGLLVAFCVGYVIFFVLFFGAMAGMSSL